MADGTEENEGGSGKVFLVLGILLGLGLGGGGGYFYFGGKTDPDAESSGKKEAPKVVKEDLLTVPFERIAVPIYATRGNSRRYIGNFFIDLQVNVRGEDNQIAVKRSMSQVQHSFVSAISRSELMQEGSSTELDVDKTAAVLKRKADEVLGVGVVESVTISKSMRIAN